MTKTPALGTGPIARFGFRSWESRAHLSSSESSRKEHLLGHTIARWSAYIWLGLAICAPAPRAGVAAEAAFFREHWARFDPNVSNYKEPRWRINDQQISLDPRFGKRWEARANGLILVEVPEYLFTLDGAELYIELWGGHAKLENKRFTLNGRDTYPLPCDGTEKGHCTYTQPTIPLKLSNLLTGINAFQFTCDRGQSFWGHYIVQNAAVRCYLKSDHPDLTATRLNTFRARVRTQSEALDDRAQVQLEVPEEFREQVASVDYFARYRGFDDSGLGREEDWHGFTLGKVHVNHVGSTDEAPFGVVWDTRMIPDQEGPLALRAVVSLKNGIKYRTAVLDGLRMARKARVRMVTCNTQPVHFASRVNRKQEATFVLPEDLSGLVRAVVLVKTWGYEPGTIKEPFTINGHPYDISKGDRCRSIIFSRLEVTPQHLKPGENRIALVSDTEHHGIEIFLPGPVLFTRFE